MSANIGPSSAVYGVMTGEAVAWPAAVDERLADPAERLGVLFDAHHQRLYRLARRLSSQSEDARDLVQETFLRAARAPEKVPSGGPSEEAWLVRVLINICRDRWRHNAVRARSAPQQVADASSVQVPSPESAFVAHTTVWRALERLPPRRRAVLILYELEGAGIPAIAKLLGVAPVTVRWHLSSGRRELAAVIRRQESEGRDRRDRQDRRDGRDRQDGQDRQDGYE